MIDIIILIICLIFAYKFYKKGLIRSILLAFSNIITLLSSIVVAKRYAVLVSEKFISPYISSYVDTYITNKIDVSKILSSLSENAQSVDNVIAKFLLSMKSENIDQILNLSSDKAAEYLRQNITSSIAYGVSYILIFILSLIVISIAFNLILSVIDFALKITFLSPINKILGGILGIAVGLLISSSIIWVMVTALPVTTLEGGILSDQKTSKITKLIIEYKPDKLSNYIN